MMHCDDSGASAVNLLAGVGARSARWHVIAANGEVRSISADELQDAALKVAKQVARLLVEQGEDADGRAVVLALSDPVEFITAFFGVQLGGGVPAPAPGMLDSHPVHMRRVLGMVDASRSKLVVTSASRVALVRRHLNAPSVRVVTVEDLQHEGSGGVDVPRPRAWGSAEWPAYLQYTSGSTAEPVPIVVRCRHLLAQLRQAATVYEEGTDSVSVAWVPLHHDMGLVTGVLRPLWSGYTSVLLQPFDFVRRPRHWVEQMTRWSATHTSAPNFGYALCAAKVHDVSELDLHSLRVARVAGELVRAHSLHAFEERFAPTGFRRVSFAPSYGLAEATLTVTTCRPGDLPREVVVSASGIRGGSVLAPAGRDDELILLSCGAPLPDTCVRILPESPPVPKSTAAAEVAKAAHAEVDVGEVWISGPQIVEGGRDHEVDGYAGRRTGDIGFMHNGELVLLGRASERFQLHGSNYYCAELEESVARACPEARPGRVAVFAGSREVEPGVPEVVVLAELRAAPDTFLASEHDARSEIASATLRREYGLPVHRVLWLKSHTLPVTTSGKLRRLECRELYRRDALAARTKGDDEHVDLGDYAAGARSGATASSN